MLIADGWPWIFHGSPPTARDSSGVYMVMQLDGNLAIYDANGDDECDGATSGNPGAYATLQTDGRLAIYSSTHQLLGSWSVLGGE